MRIMLVVFASFLLSLGLAGGWIALYPEPITRTEYEKVYVASWMDQYRDYVFRIRSVKMVGSLELESYGSGFLIRTGEILTAQHVVDGDDDGVVDLERWHGATRTRSKYRARTRKQDSKQDVAWLEFVDGGYIDPSAALELGSSRDMGYNRLVHLIGCPSASFPPTISSGVLRAEGHFFILVDSGAWYGFSGSPIVDGDSGRVIGLVVQIGFRSSERWTWGEPQTDLGLGVHVERIKELLRQWKQ